MTHDTKEIRTLGAAADAGGEDALPPAALPEGEEKTEEAGAASGADADGPSVMKREDGAGDDVSGTEPENGPEPAPEAAGGEDGPERDGPPATAGSRVFCKQGARDGKPPARGRLTGAAKEWVGSLSGSVLLRCGLVGMLTLLLLTPLDWVRDIVFEREYRHDEAAREIAQSWGGSQVVSGPVLVVPYEVWTARKEVVKVKVQNFGTAEEVEEEVERRDYHVRHKVLLPESLGVDVRLDPEMRYRGIFKKALYDAPVTLEGTFVFPKAEDFARNIHKVHWNEAWLAVGVTDLKAIADDKPLLWDGEAVSGFKSGTETAGILQNGFRCTLALDEDVAGASRRFELRFNMRGSNGISFTPVGERTKITASGKWPGPSFQGDLLPTARTIREDGFSAEWNISALTRGYPQIGELGGVEFFTAHGRAQKSLIEAFTAGVDLHENLSLYRLMFRAVNYAVLFIGVTFTALFAVEMFSGRRMQLLQYGMVGLSMSVFYLLLLSLAEHISFEGAFAAASAVTVVMNALYLAAVLGSIVRGFGMGVLISGLYGLLFALLRMEDTALLVGSGLVAAVMGVLMFVTRKPARDKNAPEI